MSNHIKKTKHEVGNRTGVFDWFVSVDMRKKTRECFIEY